MWLIVFLRVWWAAQWLSVKRFSGPLNNLMKTVNEWDRLFAIVILIPCTKNKKNMQYYMKAIPKIE